MIITIKDKEYELHFGLKFLNELNKKYNLKQNGMSANLGLEQIAAGLMQYDPIYLQEAMIAALATSKTKPSEKDLTEFIENSDIEKMCDDFFTILKNQPLTKAKMKIFGDNTKVLEETLEKIK